MAGLDELSELLLVSGDLCGVYFVEVAADTTVDDSNLKKRFKLSPRIFINQNNIRSQRHSHSTDYRDRE